MRVDVKNDNVEKALKILKKKLFDDGLINEITKRRFYEKPSETRKNKKNEAKNRQRKVLLREREQRRQGYLRGR